MGLRMGMFDGVTEYKTPKVVPRLGELHFCCAVLPRQSRALCG